MRIAFLGLGLIGGSIARALAADATRDEPLGDGTAWELTAWTPDGHGPRAALAAGVIGLAATTIAEAVEGADLVVLAAPPLACMDLLDALAGRGRLAPGAFVTDVASTKTEIADRAAALDIPFVGGHPMAGLEKTGFDAADAGLFIGRPWVITEPVFAASPRVSASREGVEVVARLARACGANPIFMTPADHDAAVAGISHLPLIVAAALVEAVVGPAGGADRVDWPAAQALSATGWASVTRLARGDVAMATGIAATNGAAIANRLRDLEAVITAWRSDLETGDRATIEARFAAARARLEASDQRRLAGRAGRQTTAARPRRHGHDPTPMTATEPRPIAPGPERVLVLPRSIAVPSPWHGLRTEPDRPGAPHRRPWAPTGVFADRRRWRPIRRSSR